MEQEDKIQGDAGFQTDNVHMCTHVCGRECGIRQRVCNIVHKH